jgi:PST family polysaccharide transporter
MATALIVINLLEIFKDLGTTSALIQSQNVSHHLKSSVFWINFTFGMVITLVIYFTAPLFSIFFNSDKNTPVLQALSLTFFIAGLSITQKALLEKDMSFKTLANIELLSSLSGFIAAIYCALSGYGVWSLVIQVLCTTLINSVLMLIYSPWKPSFYFKFDEVRVIKTYSLNLVGFNVINYIARNSDYFLIAKFLGNKPLGHYYLAYRIMLYPLQNITSVVSRVIFPSFSKVQNDNIKLRQAYLRLTNSIAVLTFPMMAGMAVVSYEFTSAFFGTNWDSRLIALLIIILAPVGAIQSLIATVGSLYQVKGKTDWMFKWSIFSTLLIVTGFVIGLNWGTIGIAGSYLICNLILLYPAFAIPFTLIDLNTKVFFKSFRNTFLSVTIMTFILLIISFIIGTSFTSLMKFIVLIVAGVLIFGTISWLINKDKLYEIKLLFPSFHKSS